MGMLIPILAIVITSLAVDGDQPPTAETSPEITMDRLREAFHADDFEALRDWVDFEQVEEGFRAQVRRSIIGLNDEPSPDVLEENPGVRIRLQMAEFTVRTFTSPRGLERLIRGGIGTDAPQRDPFRGAIVRRESDHSATVSLRGDSGERVLLFMNLQDHCWKLTGVQIPLRSSG